MRPTLSSLLAHYGVLIGVFLLPLLQIAGLLAVRHRLHPFGSRGIDTEIFMIFIGMRVVPALFWGALLGQIMQDLAWKFIEDKPRELRRLCIKVGWRGTLAQAVVPLANIGYSLVLRSQYGAAGVPRDWIQLIVTWSFLSNFCFQASLLMWVVGIFWSRGDRRVQVTENIRI